MSYTVLALLAVVLAAVVDLLLLRTALWRRRAFWVSYAIIAGFQLLINGLLAGVPVVTYNRHRILGPRLVFAPVEDLLFGFAMVTITLSLWVWWGRGGWFRPRAAGRSTRAPGRSGPPAADGAAPPSPGR
jgi:lycopene cyclase domain-containing protein